MTELPNFDWCNFCTYDESYDSICGRCEGRLFDTPSEFKEKDSVKAYRESMPEYESLKERDRAMKPDLEGDGYDPEGNMIYDTWICPNCETKYEVDYDHYDFCPKCGQRLDWSEEEEE